MQGPIYLKHLGLSSRLTTKNGLDQIASAILLEQIPYEDVPYDEVALPDRVHKPEYERAVLPQELYVPERY